MGAAVPQAIIPTGLEEPTVTDAEYHESHRVSKECECLMNRMWRWDGWSIEESPDRCRPTFAEREEYQDGFDSIITLVGGEQRRLEVKGRENLSWTCEADYRYKTVIVDDVESADRPEDEDRPPLLAYWIISADRRYYCRVHCSTRPRWIVQKHTVNGRRKPFYHCPKELCQWGAITETGFQPWEEE